MLRPRLITTIFLALSFSISIPPGGAYVIYPESPEAPGPTPVASTHFSTAFPDHLLYVAVDDSRGYEVKYAFAKNAQGQSRNVTTQYNLLLEDRKVALGLLNLITTAGQARAYAYAYVEAGQLEYQEQRRVLTSADAAAMGLPIQDPAANGTLYGWRVTLSTWEPTNGVVLDWTLEFGFSQLQTATWHVRDVARGPFTPDLHAPYMVRGHQVTFTFTASGGSSQSVHVDDLGNVRHVDSVTDSPDLYMADASAASGAPLVVGNRTTFDDSEWRVVVASPSGFSPPELAQARSLGEALAAGAKFSYDRQVRANVNPSAAACHGAPDPGPDNWGFVSRDPDCILLIYIAEPRAIEPCATWDSTATSGTTTTGIHYERHDTILLVHFDIRACLETYRLWNLMLRGPSSEPGEDHALYGDHTLEELARVVVGHEHVHYLQWIMLGDPATGPDRSRTDMGVSWPGWVEGMAVWSITVLDPDNEHKEDSFWTYWADRYTHHYDMGMCGYVPSSGPRVDLQEWANTPVGSADRYRLVSFAPYEYAPFWGALYSHPAVTPDGDSVRDNMSVILHMLQKMGERSRSGGGSCGDVMRDSIQAALVATSSETTFQDVLLWFSVELAGPRLEWAGKAWDANLTAPPPLGVLSSSARSTTATLGSYGIHYVRSDDLTRPLDCVGTTKVGESEGQWWRFPMVYRGGGEPAVHDATRVCDGTDVSRPLPPPGHEALVVVLLLANGSAPYQVRYP